MKKSPRIITRVVAGIVVVLVIAGLAGNARADTTTTSSAPATTVAPTTTLSTKPGPPTNVLVRVKGTVATISWKAPAYTGLDPIAGYTVDSSNGELYCVTTKLSCKVSPLVPGIPYKFRVRADSSAGLGELSAWSRQVTLPFWFESRGIKMKLTDRTKPSTNISLHTGINIIDGKVWVGVMTPRGVGKKQIVNYFFQLIDADKNVVATFGTRTNREKVVIGSLTAPPGRYQVHITAELKSGRKLTWHGSWITVK